MQIDANALFNDPRLMLFGFDGQVARFVKMTRESYARSIFFDRRLQPADPQFIQVPLEPLLDEAEKVRFDPPRLRFIHHFAHSGSTLLARALDHPGNLVIREPVHLRKLGIARGSAPDSPADSHFCKLLNLFLIMLGKRFGPDCPVIVKGNVPTSLLADMIADADPGQPAILLYLPLEDYCAAVLRTPNHRAWVEAVITEIDLSQDPNIGEISSLGVAEKAAVLWFSMIKRFEGLLADYPEMKSLDANCFFKQPEDVLEVANEFLGAGLTGEEARSIAKGPLFSTYSKNPTIAYDNAERIRQREETKAVHREELEIARKWVEDRATEIAIPERLSRPLSDVSQSLL